MWNLVHLKSTLHMQQYLFELENCPQGLHHRVFLVVLYQVGQGVKLLTSTNIILQILLQEEQQKLIRTSLTVKQSSHQLPQFGPTFYLRRKFSGSIVHNAILVQ